MYLQPEQSRLLYQDAVREKYAILAINADSPAAIIDCLEAAKRVDAPVIIESSLWQLSSHSFGHGDAVLGLARFAAMVQLYADSAAYQDVPVIYHTDHIKGPQTLDILRPAIQGIAAGALRASSISLDSSALSADENIALIRQLCVCAEDAGVALTLEMEAGVDDGLTSIDEARYLLESVEHMNPGYLSLWAPGVGTRHGYSADGFPGFSTQQVAAQQQLASQICQREIGLALHGSSGLSDQQLREAVAAGVIKVNWSTDSLACRSAAAAAYYQKNAAELHRSHAAFKQTAMDNGVQSAVSEIYCPVVAERMQVLNGAGRGRRFCQAQQERVQLGCA